MTDFDDKYLKMIVLKSEYMYIFSTSLLYHVYHFLMTQRYEDQKYKKYVLESSWLVIGSIEIFKGVTTFFSHDSFFFFHDYNVKIH